ncbi:MAG: MFS transporter [Oscillospiraceae bacterium]|nr:MFS transporter [Oscillospiraceae bacterium]
MALITPERRQLLRYIGRHPVKWWRGRDLPSDQVRPWEQGVHMLHGVTGLRNGFLWQDMWVLQNVFHVQPTMQALGLTVTGVFDGLTDPLVGAYMDTRDFKLVVHRWLVRISIFANNLLRVVPLLPLGGISNLQRIVLFIITRCLGTLIGTPAAVSGVKLVVHTTDDGNQRRKINLAQGISETIHEMLVPTFWALIGLHNLLGWSEYGLIMAGIAILLIPTMLVETGPTFVIQRVPDHVQPSVGEFGIKGTMKSIVEAFKVTRHNKYFWLDNFRALFIALMPSVSEADFFRFSNISEIVGLGDQGEFIMWMRDNLVSLPSNVLVPVALPIINKLGGPRNTQVLHESIVFTANLARAIVGINTLPRFGFHAGMELLIRTFGRVANSVAHRINEFEMLDYVEWKTGRRSEGANMAVNGLKRKLITNNIDAVTGRLFLQHVLGFDPALGHGRGDGLPGQGERYLRYMPLMYLWVPVFNGIISFLSRWLYRYPNETRLQVEADLAERRRLVEEGKARLDEEERETVGVGTDD